MSDCRFGVSPVNYPDPDPDCKFRPARRLLKKGVRILGILHAGGGARGKPIIRKSIFFRVRKSDLASSWFNCLSAPTRSACPSLPTNFNDEWHALLIHQCMHISYYTHILINATTLRHFTLLCATLLSLCVPLRYFTLLYSALLYLGTSDPGWKECKRRPYCMSKI